MPAGSSALRRRSPAGLTNLSPSADGDSVTSVLAALATSPSPKDAMVAIFGASAGAAGLVLVFVGILVTAIAGYPGETSQTTLRPFRLGVWAALGVFGLSLVTTALSLTWLAMSESRPLYVATICVFVTLLVALFALAVAVVKTTV
jgi:hypothetical protein